MDKFVATNFPISVARLRPANFYEAGGKIIRKETEILFIFCQTRFALIIQIASELSEYVMYLYYSDVADWDRIFMQIHQLQPNHKSHDKKIVGRGGKKGTYSGRGGKGQSARSGRKMAPIIRELIKRYPKLKGYRSFVLEDTTKVVNLDALDKRCKDGETVSPQNLIKKGIIRMIKGKTPKVKILGNGKIAKKIIVEGCDISASAKEAIEKAGGSVR